MFFYEAQIPSRRHKLEVNDCGRRSKMNEDVPLGYWRNKIHHHFNYQLLYLVLSLFSIQFVKLYYQHKSKKWGGKHLHILHQWKFGDKESKLRWKNKYKGVLWGQCNKNISKNKNKRVSRHWWHVWFDHVGTKLLWFYTCLSSIIIYSHGWIPSLPHSWVNHWNMLCNCYEW